MAAHGPFNCSYKHLTPFSDCCMHMVPQAYRQASQLWNNELNNSLPQDKVISLWTCGPAALPHPCSSNLPWQTLLLSRHLLLTLGCTDPSPLGSLAVFALLISSHNLRTAPSLIRLWHAFPETTVTPSCHFSFVKQVFNPSFEIHLIHSHLLERRFEGLCLFLYACKGFLQVCFLIHPRNHALKPLMVWKNKALVTSKRFSLCVYARGVIKKLQIFPLHYHRDEEEQIGSCQDLGAEKIAKLVEESCHS